MQVQILTKEQHQEMQTLKDKYDQSHGSPFDVGACDSYYYRPASPNYWEGGSKVRGKQIFEADMTAEQIEAYHAGYAYNDWLGDKKDWF
ncbi:MAG: hypothetical protein VW270_18865 [Candidatus Poseidoniales archaeon]